MDLLLITYEGKSHFVNIKDLCLTLQEMKMKNGFAEVASNLLVVKVF